MSTASPSDFLAGVRRMFAAGSIVALSVFTVACGDDDDDDDGGTGPSADCIDEIDFVGAFFDEDDVQTINVGQSRSGNLSGSDPAFEGYHYDLYAIDVASSGGITIEVDPEASFDVDVALFYPDGNSEEEWYADSGFEGDTETLDLNVASGCYVIGVSSFEPGATGSYTLSVD